MHAHVDCLHPTRSQPSLVWLAAAAPPFAVPLVAPPVVGVWRGCYTALVGVALVRVALLAFCRGSCKALVRRRWRGKALVHRHQLFPSCCGTVVAERGCGKLGAVHFAHLDFAHGYADFAHRYACLLACCYVCLLTCRYACLLTCLHACFLTCRYARLLACGHLHDAPLCCVTLDAGP